MNGAAARKRLKSPVDTPDRPLTVSGHAWRARRPIRPLPVLQRADTRRGRVLLRVGGNRPGHPWLTKKRRPDTLCHMNAAAGRNPMTLRSVWKEAISKGPGLPPERPTPESMEEHRRACARWKEETFRNVEITPKIENPDIGEEDRLRRFMDLPKLLDLIIHRRLLLPRLAQLRKCDPHECTAGPDYSQVPREELERMVIDLSEFMPKSFRDGSFFERYGGFEQRVTKLSREDLMQAVWFVEHSRLQHDLVCSCWYGREMESDAMWRLYCDRVGVAITTSASRLKASVKCVVANLFVDRFKLYLAKVTYSDKLCCSPSVPWLIKRVAFEHEHEVRLYADYPLDTEAGFIDTEAGFFLHIDPEVLIEKIVVTPYAEKWQSEVIEAAIQKLLNSRIVGCARPGSVKPVIVRQPDHLDAPNPTWPGPQLPRRRALL